MHFDYKIYFKLKRIVNFCSTDEAKKDDIGQFEVCVNEFINLFIQEYDDDTITFKMHHLVHYVTLIEVLDKSKDYNPLPYERVIHKMKRSTEYTCD